MNADSGSASLAFYVRIRVFLLFGPPGSASGSVNQRYGSEDPHPDPYQNVTDPQNWYGSYVCVT
jgi:hypothetical protein